MKMEPIEGSETSAIINQTPGNYPKGNLIYSVHGESLKSTLPLPLLPMGMPFFIYAFFFRNTARDKNDGLMPKLPKKNSASWNW